MPRLDLPPGTLFGSWTVLNEAPRKTGQPYARYFLCRCVCGTEREVFLHHLKRGKSTNCGCIQSAALSQRQTTHGQSRSPEYISWKAMRWRCSGLPGTHPAYAGVTIDPRWDSFETFLADMGPKPHPKDELDRRDSTLGYSKDNCRWLARLLNIQARWDQVRGIPGKAESGIDRRCKYRPVTTDSCRSFTVEESDQEADPGLPVDPPAPVNTDFAFGALVEEPLYVPPF
jgi:hypothetical protein